MYAALHFSIFVGLDYGFDPQLIGEAIAEKRFVLVGFTAFLLLLPLAITSTKGWMRRLGKRWKQLHRLVYVAAVLVIFHYIWLVKADIREPLAYGALVALLFVLRAPPVRRAITRFRQRHTGAMAADKHAQPAKASASDKVFPLNRYE
jgi:sulfoxide reductase heme-binding subunit YedZ